MIDLGRVSFCRAVAWLEIGGGAFGLILIVRALLAPIKQTSVGFVLLAVTFFGASVWAGWVLLRKGSAGLIPSMIIQMLQVPRLSLYGFTYSMASGAHASLDFRNGTLLFNGQLGSHLSFGAAGMHEVWMVGLNNLALAILLGLLRTERVMEGAKTSGGSAAEKML